jgi:branched-chain amino acid transport system substrate-binding protein
MKLDSPRGPLEIDPRTREVIQNIYIRRGEKRGNMIVNAEFVTFPNTPADIR